MVCLVIQKTTAVLMKTEANEAQLMTVVAATTGLGGESGSVSKMVV